MKYVQRILKITTGLYRMGIMFILSSKKCSIVYTKLLYDIIYIFKKYETKICEKYDIVVLDK